MPDVMPIGELMARLHQEREARTGAARLVLPFGVDAIDRAIEHYLENGKLIVRGNEFVLADPMGHVQEMLNATD